MFSPPEDTSAQFLALLDGKYCDAIRTGVLALTRTLTVRPTQVIAVEIADDRSFSAVSDHHFVGRASTAPVGVRLTTAGGRTLLALCADQNEALATVGMVTDLMAATAADEDAVLRLPWGETVRKNIITGVMRENMPRSALDKLTPRDNSVLITTTAVGHLFVHCPSAKDAEKTADYLTRLWRQAGDSSAVALEKALYRGGEAYYYVYNAAADVIVR